MHGMAMGGAFVFVLATNFFYQTYLGADIAAAALIAGLVCSSRLILGGHNNFELIALY